MYIISPINLNSFTGYITLIYSTLHYYCVKFHQYHFKWCDCIFHSTFWHQWTGQHHQLSDKVKCTLVQALRLCTGHKAHRGSRGIALLFLDHGTRRGWKVSITPRSLFTPGKDPVPIVQEAGWAPGLVWTGAENLAPTGIQSLDRPARSQSLYLRYLAHSCLVR